MRLNPHHVFDFAGRTILVTPESMQARCIDAATAELITRVAHDSAAAPSAAEVGQLTALGLCRRQDSGNLIPVHQAQSAQRPPSITALSLFVTQRCNFRCIYCYGDGGSYGSGGDMAEQTAFQAVDWLIRQSGDARELSVHFFGGEPLLRFNLIQQLVAYCHQQGRLAGKSFSFAITTNGSLLNDENIAFIKSQRIKPFVSFDGPRTLQDRQRPMINGKGSYDLVLPKLQRLISEVPETTCRAILMDDSARQPAHEALRELGFSKTLLTLYSPSLFGNGQGRRARDLAPMLERVEYEARLFTELVGDRAIDALRLLARQGILPQHIEQFQHHRKRHFLCGAGRRYVAVTVDGDVYLCHRLAGQAGQKLGHIGSDALCRDQYQTTPVDKVEKCFECHAKYICSGGCYHDNLGTSGSIFEPDSAMCPLTRRIGELAAGVFATLSTADREFLEANQVLVQSPSG